jgi:cbb3-type cytochrome oxidase subunit 3
VKQEAFQHYSDQSLTIVGLFIFVTFFVGLLFWVYRRTQSSHYKYMSQLPLEGDFKS